MFKCFIPFTFPKYYESKDSLFNNKNVESATPNLSQPVTVACTASDSTPQMLTPFFT